MQAMLHGFRRVDIVDRKTGAPVKGYSVFISYPSPGVQGLECAKQFVFDDVASASGWSPVLDCLVNLDFTPKGKVCGISTVREK